MKKNTNQFNGSHADRINNGGGKFRRIALFPLMLFMLLLLPTRMVAQTDYAYAEFNNSTRTLTFKCGLPSPKELMSLMRGLTIRGGLPKVNISRRWSSMLRLPMQDQRAVITGSLAARI